MTPAASVGDRERPRLFLGFRLPPDTVERLAVWQQRELSGGRIVPPENLHVTLAFLGARPVAELEPIGQALRESAAAAERPALTPSRYRETRSVGMVVADDEDGRGAAIAGDLFGRLERLGVYEREQRPWLPHITVLRFRERPRLDPPLPDLGSVRLSEAAVYHSVLRPSGAQYEVLESVALGG
jgi:RNA 2',3'-cyclic 3'-phosphodiesterase